MMPERPTFDIELLLRAQRGAIKVETTDTGKSHHHVSYKALVEVLRNYGIVDAPALAIVDSTHALTEMVNVGSSHWLVYDLHLDRILARLKAVSDADATLRSVDADLTRIFISRLLVHGRTRQAWLVAVFHLNRLIDDLVDAEDSAASHETILRAQEVFVLAHELMHFVFAEHPEKASMLTKMYFMLCEAEESDVDERPSISVEEMANALAEDVNREWVRRNGQIDEGVLAAGKKELVARLLEDAPSISRHMSQTARCNIVLSEEVVCDAGAAILTAMVVGDGTPERTLEVLSAVFDANQKLRLIAHMDSQITGHETRVTGLLHASNRGSQLRQFYRALYESGLTKIFFGFETNDAVYDGMLDRIRTINEGFYSKLFDQLLTGTFYTQFASFTDPQSTLLSRTPESIHDCQSVAIDLMRAEE